MTITMSRCSAPSSCPGPVMHPLHVALCAAATYEFWARLAGISRQGGSACFLRVFGLLLPLNGNLVTSPEWEWVNARTAIISITLVYKWMVLGRGEVSGGRGVWRSAECATSLLFFNWVASAQVSNHSLCPQRGIISTCVAWQTGSARLDDTPQCLFLNKYKPVHSIIFDFVQSIHDDMMKYLFYGKFVCHICIMSCMRRYETLFLINWGSFYFFHNLKAEIIKTGTWRMR